MPPKLENNRSLRAQTVIFSAALSGCLCILSHSHSISCLWWFTRGSFNARVLSAGVRGSRGYHVHIQSLVLPWPAQMLRHVDITRTKNQKNGGSTENCWAKATSYPPSTEGCSGTCHDGLCHVHLSLSKPENYYIYILIIHKCIYT